MKLRGKFLILLIPLVVVPLLFVGYMAYNNLKDAAEAKTFEQIDAGLNRHKALMASRVRVAEANVELFSSANLVREYFQIDDEAERYYLLQRPVMRLFKSYQLVYPEYYEIRLLLPDGYEEVRWSAADLKNQTEEEADSPFFLAMQRWPEDVYTEVSRNPDTQTIALLVSRKLVLRNESQDPALAEPTLRGHLVLTVDLGDLHTSIETEAIGELGFYVATDPAGRVVFQPDGYSLDRLMPSLDPSRLIDSARNRQRLLTRFQGQDAYLEGIQLHRDLYLFAILPAEQLLTSSWRLGAAVAVITLLAILLTAGTLYAAINHLVIRPIEMLRRAAQDIGRGNLTVPIETTSADEIGDLAASFKVMSENLRESNDQVEFLAYHDSLTGLPNRRMFNEYLERAIQQGHRSDELLAVLFLDLDNFKRINDTLGHQTGDRLLRQVADYLSSQFRQEDCVARPAKRDAGHVLARLGGDEFIILLRDVRDDYSPGAAARRICQFLAQPFVVDNHELYVSASIGIAVYPTDADSADQLIGNADAAMYHAKQQGRNNYQYYSQSMNEAAARRLLLESSLRRALENDLLELYYQPKVESGSTRIIGAEALIRWRDPDLGMVSPATFIPIAEETGLILPIGEWVLKQACTQAKVWQDAGLPKITMSVNVSPIQVARQDLTQIVQQTLETTGVDPACLDIEITESTIMSSEDRAVAILTDLRRLGVSVSLDDFGTGYSALSYLRRFPIDGLKIDRSFVKDLFNDASCTTIISAIIAMAHGLNLQVTAEGVEEQQQWQFLRRQRCDFIQGYLFSRPLPAEEFRAVLAQGTLKAA